MIEPRSEDPASLNAAGRFRPAFLLRAALLFAALAAGAGVLASGRMECAYARLLHAPCPACGSTRAVLALARLDFAAALRFNPLAPLVAVLLAALGAHAVFVMARDGDVRALGDPPVGRLVVRLLLGALAAQLAVWALRYFGLFGGPCPV